MCMTEAKKRRMKRDQKICKMISNGKDTFTTAKECGCCHETVVAIAKTNGLRLNPKQGSRPGAYKGCVLSILWHLLNTKETQTQIAERFDFSRQYLNQVTGRAREAGFKIPRRTKP